MLDGYWMLDSGYLILENKTVLSTNLKLEIWNLKSLPAAGSLLIDKNQQINA